MKIYDFRAERRGAYTDTLPGILNEYQENGWEIMSVQLVDQAYTQSLAQWMIVARKERF